MQPKNYQKPRILCLNIELELKAERDNAECRINSVEVVTFTKYAVQLKKIGQCNINTGATL